MAGRVEAVRVESRHPLAPSAPRSVLPRTFTRPHQKDDVSRSRPQHVVRGGRPNGLPGCLVHGDNCPAPRAAVPRPPSAEGHPLRRPSRSVIQGKRAPFLPPLRAASHAQIDSQLARGWPLARGLVCGSGPQLRLTLPLPQPRPKRRNPWLYGLPCPTDTTAPRSRPAASSATAVRSLLLSPSSLVHNNIPRDRPSVQSHSRRR